MDPFTQLLTDSSNSSVAPETLEMLGRQASQLFQAQGVPLNAAVHQVTANHPELGVEHIKRIVEFANTVTFQEMFQNSEDKNVHFDVADPGAVIRDLKDGGSPAHSGKPLSNTKDYQAAPQQGVSPELNQAFDSQFLGNSGGEQAKVANIKNLGEWAHKAKKKVENTLSSIRQDPSRVTRPLKKNTKALVGTAALGAAAYTGARGAKRLIDGPQEKTAAQLREENSVDHDLHANPIEDVYDAHLRLQASREKLAGSYESMHIMLKAAQAEMYNLIKEEVLDPDGAGLGGVISVLEKVAEPDILAALMEPMTRQLMADGINPNELQSSLQKTAGAVVNMEHPLIHAADAIVKLAGEMVTCSQGIDDLDEMIVKTSGALTSGVRDAIDHKGNLPAGIRQRFPRG